ncbi:MAG TPA: FAD-dependent oxidoreductase [Candidatus Limnocylindrales bacterium]|nr:FAD-dependent oxidoreductase [Candidatus Limnocylindrales bacterium]
MDDPRLIEGDWPDPRAARDYRGVSYWLESCGDDLTPRPSLEGTLDADVAIVGAGYTGLWTAFYLLRAEPSLRVVVLEAEIAGFGASGRNGAWCDSGLNVSLGLMEKKFGFEQARAAHQLTFEAVDEVGRATAEAGIDAGFHKGGELAVARGRQQLPSLDHLYQEYVRFGFEDRYRLLDRDQLNDRLHIADALGAVNTDECAVIHPGRLARGLARAVERLGGTIFERTPVLEYRANDLPRVRTPGGEVRARYLVLAGEAYLTRMSRLHRALLPVYSLIVLTEPLDEATWRQIGWQNRECVQSFRLSIDYLSKTEDGRILFGGRGAPYRFGSPIRDAYDRHAPTHEMLRNMCREWFPMLKDVRFTHAWGGPLGIPRDWMPTMSLDRRSGVGRAGGYTGHGVAMTNMAGRTMTDLILERRSALTEMPWVGHRSPSWEPEPFRWIGVRFTQEGLRLVDARAERTGEPPSGRTLPELIARH